MKQYFTEGSTIEETEMVDFIDTFKCSFHRVLRNGAVLNFYDTDMELVYSVDMTPLLGKDSFDDVRLNGMFLEFYSVGALVDSVNLNPILAQINVRLQDVETEIYTVQTLAQQLQEMFEALGGTDLPYHLELDGNDLKLVDGNDVVLSTVDLSALGVEVDLSGVEERLDDLETFQTSAEGRLDSAESRLDSLEAQEECDLSSIESRLDTLEAKEECECDFSAIEGRLDVLEAKEECDCDLSPLEERLDDLETFQTFAESHIEDLETFQTSAETRLDDLESLQLATDGRLDDCEGTLEDLEGSLETLEGSLETLEGSFETLEETVSNIVSCTCDGSGSGGGDCSCDLSGIEGRLDDLEGSLETLESSLETLEEAVEAFPTGPTLSDFGLPYAISVTSDVNSYPSRYILKDCDGNEVSAFQAPTHPTPPSAIASQSLATTGVLTNTTTYGTTSTINWYNLYNLNISGTALQLRSNNNTVRSTATLPNSIVSLALNGSCLLTETKVDGTTSTVDFKNLYFLAISSNNIQLRNTNNELVSEQTLPKWTNAPTGIASADLTRTSAGVQGNTSGKIAKGVRTFPTALSNGVYMVVGAFLWTASGSATSGANFTNQHVTFCEFFNISASGGTQVRSFITSDSGALDFIAGGSNTAPLNQVNVYVELTTTRFGVVVRGTFAADSTLSINQSGGSFGIYRLNP